MREVDGRHPRRGTFESETERFYVRTFLLTRLVVGAAGLALPVLLIVGNWVVSRGDAPVLGSLSAYYHSGMRDVLVATLSVVGLLLITYMWFYWDWDYWLSTAAGALAIVVAFFPTGGGETPTALQQYLGEGFVKTIHFVAAVGFILCLAAVCRRFGAREATRPQRPASAQPDVLEAVPLLVAAVIWGALAGRVVFKGVQAFGWLTIPEGRDYSLLLVETVAVWAFGTSWLLKGWERDGLRGDRTT